MSLKDIEVLSRPATLWTLFIIGVITFSMMRYSAAIWELQLLDRAYNPSEVRNLLATMSQDQKTAHAWITATLDFIFPIILCGLFLGLTQKLTPKYSHYLVIPAILGLLLDLPENAIQILALLDVYDLLEAKSLITPAKFAFFSLAFLIVIAGMCNWLFLKFKLPVAKV